MFAPSTSSRTSSPTADPDSGRGEPQAIPPGRAEYADDMSHDEVIAVPRDRDSDDYLSRSITEIDARIAEIEAALADCVPLVQERERLVRASAALRGEPPPPSLSPRRRITRADVLDLLRANPGLRAGRWFAL